MNKLISIYQDLKPVRTQLLLTLGVPPHACRHHPTCSQFAKSAISTHGPLKGSLIGLKRLLSCHPYSS